MTNISLSIGKNQLNVETRKNPHHFLLTKAKLLPTDGFDHKSSIFTKVTKLCQVYLFYF